MILNIKGVIFNKSSLGQLLASRHSLSSLFLQRPLSTLAKARGMDNSNSSSTSAAANPKVHQLQQLISHRSGGWEKSWEEGVTPWDIGGPTPVVLHLHQTGALPLGTALVPGCGSGHDVVAMACPERRVVGIDIAEFAIKKAKESFSALPNANYFTFLKADFFTWRPNELFDLIFDYTFFCAIPPEMRSAWARKIDKMLKPDGELITLMFPVSDRVGGPPYKAAVLDYEEVLHPCGFTAISILDNDLAIKPRMGNEKLGRWKRLQNSPL